MRCLLLSGNESDVNPQGGEIESPSPGPDEVLIRVRAAGIIPTEVHWYPTWHTKTGESRIDIVPGHEFSGSIAALGSNVTGFRVGDEVFGMNDWFANGALAEYCLANPSDINPKPSGLTHAEAASVPISALTSWQGLIDKAQLRSGERVLVHGGAGSVGAFVVQLAKIQGAEVTATASGRDLEFVRELGADSVIDYRTQRFEAIVSNLDVVFDTVGGETLERSWGLLAQGGRMVTVAHTEADGTGHERARQAAFIVKPDRGQLDAIAKLLEAGKLRTFVAATVPLSEAADVYRGRLQQQGRGKVVVTLP